MTYPFEYTRKGPDHVLATDLGIWLRFSRLREEHGEDVAILRVYTIDYPGLPDRDLFVGKIILLGPRSKADAAKLCEQRCRTFTDWLDLLDDACKRLLAVKADGEPWIDLSVGEVESEPPWLLEPMLRTDEPAILYGSGGSGKSTVGLAWAMLLASDSPELWGFKRPVEKGQTAPRREVVGYLDFEDSPNTFRRRLRWLAAGAGIPVPKLHYKRGEASVPASAEALGRQIADLGITGLVVDSAGYACGGEPERSESALNYWRAMRSLPISWSLTIAHQPKDKENSSYPFGSIMWWNGCRACWKLTGEPGPDGLNIALQHKKANNGELQATTGLLFRRDENGAHLEHRDPRQIVGLGENLKSTAQIIEFLRENGPMEQNDIADAAKLAHSGARTTLRRLVERGLIVELGEAMYSLPVEITEVLPGFDS